jgi:hypothetical protein
MEVHIQDLANLPRSRGQICALRPSQALKPTQHLVVLDRYALMVNRSLRCDLLELHVAGAPAVEEVHNIHYGILAGLFIQTGQFPPDILEVLKQLLAWISLDQHLAGKVPQGDHQASGISGGQQMKNLLPYVRS